MKVLVVENDEVFSNGLNWYLEKEDIAVDIVKSVKDAVKAVKKNSYDLICADYKLPDGTGVDLCHMVQKIRKQRFIILTVYAKYECDEDITELPIEAWIEKISFNPEKFIELVRKKDE